MTFYFRDGKAENLEEFRAVLSTLSEEEFTQYVTGEKNDFASWIREALNRPDLASEVGGCSTKEQILSCLSPKVNLPSMHSREGRKLPPMPSPPAPEVKIVGKHLPANQKPSKESHGGFLEHLSPTMLLAAGLILGLVLGLIAGRFV